MSQEFMLHAEAWICKNDMNIVVKTAFEKIKKFTALEQGKNAFALYFWSKAGWA